MRAYTLGAQHCTHCTKLHWERLSVAYPIDERLRKSNSPKSKYTSIAVGFLST